MPEPGPAALDPQVVVEEMAIADYDAVRALLHSTPGVTRRSADSRDATSRYLARNPGLNFVARSQGRIVGCVMCGHDGRRGYLQHLAVEPSRRRLGIGTALVHRCIESLRCLGIDKTHLDVLAGNRDAQQYWINRGWLKRDDIVRFSFIGSADPDA